MPRSSARVGALFRHDASGNHCCTASAVVSPGRDLLVTAGVSCSAYLGNAIGQLYQQATA